MNNIMKLYSDAVRHDLSGSANFIEKHFEINTFRHMPNVFKVGDIVEIVGTLGEAPIDSDDCLFLYGWNCNWCSQMHNHLGQSSRIYYVDPTVGYSLIIGRDPAIWWYPSFLLKKVE